MMKKLFAALLIIIIECNMLCFTAFAADGSSKKKAIEIEELDKLYYGTISKKGQEDWYKLTTGSEDAYYYFTLDDESGDSKLLCLYNEREKRLLSVVAGYGDSSTENIKLGPNTTYYLQASIQYSGIGNYSFKISKKVDEVGDERKEAMEVDMDTIYYQSIDGDGDEDWYCISIGSGVADCSFYLKNESATSDLLMSVYNERDAELLYVGPLYVGKEGTKSIKLEPDAKYYLKVYMQWGYGTGNYAFEILQCANGHTPSEAWTTTLEPTCLSNGERSRICSVCGKAVQTESVDALGHSSSGTWTTVSKPTCLSNGERRKICSVCGEIVQTESINALGHEYVNEETVKESTWLSLGSKKSLCSRCGDVAYSKDWSKAWILPFVIVGCIAVLIGIINYARVFAKARR